MNKRKEKRLLKKKWKRLKDHLKCFLLTENQTELHQFRVQIKKIKSLIKLFSSHKKDPKLAEAFKPVNKIFHQGGKIREVYIHLQLANQFKVRNKEFYSGQSELMTNKISKFRKKSKTFFTTISITRKAVEKELQGFNNRNISKFYESELNSIVLILAKREFNESMHECRKKIKNTIYNRKLILRSSEEIPDLNLPYLKKVEEKLGEWHDAILARELFQSHINDQRNISKIDVKISRIERSIKSISANFWQKVTRVDQP